MLTTNKNNQCSSCHLFTKLWHFIKWLQSHFLIQQVLDSNVFTASVHLACSRFLVLSTCTKLPNWQVNSHTFIALVFVMKKNEMSSWLCTFLWWGHTYYHIRTRRKFPQQEHVMTPVGLLLLTNRSHLSPRENVKYFQRVQCSYLCMWKLN